MQPGVAGWAPTPRTGAPRWLLPATAIVVVAAVAGGLLFFRSSGDGDPDETGGPGRSPEGRALFASEREGNWQIYIADGDGSNPRNITNSQSRDEPGAPSPDGERVAFRSDRDGSSEIYVMDIEGGEATRVTDGGGRNFWPSWSPDSSRIVFTRDRGGATGVYVMDADGSNLQPVVSQVRGHPGYSVVSSPGHSRPFFSPDGGEIVFEAESDGNAEIFVVTIGSGEIRRLTSDAGQDRGPAWSPDGELIVFMSDRDGNNEIYSMGSDGSEQTRLTNEPASDSFPSFTTDGEHIVFESARAGPNDDIWLMDADGGNPRVLIEDPAREHAPLWLP